jgi:dihydrolipoamide dehydrogenase
VIGGGYIGLELGSVWSRLGSEVTVIEYLDRIAPGIDVEVSLQFQKILQKQGLKFILNSEVLSISSNSGDLDILMKDHKSGEEDSLQSDIALVSAGRKPYVDGLFSEDPIINIKENGFIDIDKHFRTSVEGIWAIGDVVEGPMLAHKAEEEGIAVAELIAGKPGHVNYNIIPSVIYTNPEVASVGMSEEQLQSDSVDYKVGKFPFLANGRAKVNKTTEGFVKVLSSSETDRILGVHILCV